jgi:hypothetical protein
MKLFQLGYGSGLSCGGLDLSFRRHTDDKGRWASSFPRDQTMPVQYDQAARRCLARRLTTFHHEKWERICEYVTK